MALLMTALAADAGWQGWPIRNQTGDWTTVEKQYGYWGQIWSGMNERAVARQIPEEAYYSFRYGWTYQYPSNTFMVAELFRTNVYGCMQWLIDDPQHLTWVYWVYSAVGNDGYLRGSFVQTNQSQADTFDAYFAATTNADFPLENAGSMGAYVTNAFDTAWGPTAPIIKTGLTAYISAPWAWRGTPETAISPGDIVAGDIGRNSSVALSSYYWTDSDLQLYECRYAGTNRTDTNGVYYFYGTGWVKQAGSGMATGTYLGTSTLWRDIARDSEFAYRPVVVHKWGGTNKPAGHSVAITITGEVANYMLCLTNSPFFVGTSATYSATGGATTELGAAWTTITGFSSTSAGANRADALIFLWTNRYFLSATEHTANEVLPARIRSMQSMDERQEILRHLVWSRTPGLWSAPYVSNSYTWASGSQASWSAAKVACAAATPTATTENSQPKHGTRGNMVVDAEGNTSYYAYADAQASCSTSSLQGHAEWQYTVEQQWYATPALLAYSGVDAVFDDDGYGWTAGYNQVVNTNGANTMWNVVTSPALGSLDFPASWCSEPTTNSASTYDDLTGERTYYSSKGWTLNAACGGSGYPGYLPASDVWCLTKWDAHTNGFTMR